MGKAVCVAQAQLLAGGETKEGSRRSVSIAPVRNAAGTRRDPGPSASGEGHLVVREGSMPHGRDADGSVHKSPVRPFPHAHQNQSLHRWKLDLFPSLGLGVIDSHPKRGKRFFNSSPPVLAPSLVANSALNRPSTSSA
jgi:hypothetical protein